MESRRMTNVMLVLIFLCLLGLLLTRSPIKELSAETLRLDSCITIKPYDRPQSYVHVVMHDVAPVQAEEASAEKPAKKEDYPRYSY